ncbi:MAG: hypothetical protein K2K57_04275 [Oscillospiraceae bacterium]|nr:hypothetical protein [Oscillospiraceae bacterium]
MKKYLTLAAALILFTLTACSDKSDGNAFTGEMPVTENTEVSSEEMISESDNVSPAESDEPTEEVIIQDEADDIWLLPDENELYDCDIIADFTIIQTEDINISYTFMGVECTSYKTLATVRPNKVYYSRDTGSSEEYVVAIPDKSRSAEDDFPKIQDGERCFFFITSTSGLNDSLELDKYAGYYLSSPAHIVNISGNECTANSDLFYGYSSNSAYVPDHENEPAEGEVLAGDNVQYKSERCSMPFEDFENTLTDKIHEKHPPLTSLAG